VYVSRLWGRGASRRLKDFFGIFFYEKTSAATRTIRRKKNNPHNLLPLAAVAATAAAALLLLSLGLVPLRVLHQHLDVAVQVEFRKTNLETGFSPHSLDRGLKPCAFKLWGST
jgi:hypothetical protein